MSVLERCYTDTFGRKNLIDFITFFQVSGFGVPYLESLMIRYPLRL